MNKKLLATLTSGALLLSLAGCSNGGTTTPTAEAGGGETTAAPAEGSTYRIGVSIYKFDDNFMTLYRTELESYLTGMTDGNTYQVDIQDGKGDQAEQTNQIDNFIQQGYDALIINLVQSTSAATVIDKCKEANIPCIFINRQPSDEDMDMYKDDATYGGKYTYVGADARQSGKFQGEIVADLPNKGDLNGDGTLSYIMIQGDPENVDAQYRTEFSISQYEESSGLKTEQLDMQRGDWDQTKGQEIAANDLTKFGDQIEVIFCNNDAMALGAAQAITAANRVCGENIYLLGVDALADAISLIKDGGMTGTVYNDHVSQSHTAADAAIRAIKGEPLDQFYWVDYIKVTQDNIDSYNK